MNISNTSNNIIIDEVATIHLETLSITDPIEVNQIEVNIESDTVDISNVNNINEIYENDITKKWIKLIPLNKTILFDEYNHKNLFKLVANVELDNAMKSNGTKQRNTLIQFSPVISNEEFKEKTTEWIYIFTINGRIVKIGGTRTGLKGRIGSYLCGHHVEERGKSGDCSKTNGYIYNTFVFYLNAGCEIKMYAFSLPNIEVEVDILGITTKVLSQTYHAYESTIMNAYKKNYGNIPVLCDNSDPEYRD